MFEQWVFGARLALLALGCTAGAAFAQTTITNTTTLIIQHRTTTVVDPGAGTRPAVAYSPPPNLPIQPRELLPYMSPRCAQLYETQLGGPGRRAVGSTAAELRNEFQTNCPDAVSEARKSAYQDKLQHYNAAQSSKVASNEAARQNRLTQQQCDEMLRILADRRKRVDSMDEGQKDDQAHFEANYSARCKAG